MENLTVTGKIMGTSAKLFEEFSGTTIGDLKEEMELEGNYSYNLNGKPATVDTVLNNGAYVVFAPAVKGAGK